MKLLVILFIMISIIFNLAFHQIYPDMFRLITKNQLDHPLAGRELTILLKNFTLKAKRDVFAFAKLQKHVKKNHGTVLYPALNRRKGNSL